MQWIQAKVAFEHTDMRLAEELISDVFYELDLQGVVVESPEAEPSDGWWDETVERPEVHSVIGYISRLDSDRKIPRLETELARLGERHGISARAVYETVDEEDWAEAWKAFLKSS